MVNYRFCPGPPCCKDSMKPSHLKCEVTAHTLMDCRRASQRPAWKRKPPIRLTRVQLGCKEADGDSAIRSVQHGHTRHDGIQSPSVQSPRRADDRLVKLPLRASVCPLGQPAHTHTHTHARTHTHTTHTHTHTHTHTRAQIQCRGSTYQYLGDLAQKRCLNPESTQIFAQSF